MSNRFVMFVALFLIAFLWGCSTCRRTSVEDADRYSRNGYETRIVVYKTGLDGLISGGFIWDHHAQAQVLVDNEWKWVGPLGLSDAPSYTIADNEIFYWRPIDYSAFLKQQNRYN